MEKKVNKKNALFVEFTGFLSSKPKEGDDQAD